MGGGNSGLEEGLFLTQIADHVTVVQSGPTLTASKLLQDKVLNHPKMTVLLNSKAESFHANQSGKLSSVTLSRDGENVEHVTAGAFIFIGLDPNSEFLNGELEVDQRGLLVTDPMFQTRVKGVFAAGDVRSGSTTQIASAVGEGAAAAIQIRYHFEGAALKV